ncbi:hypothetical protein K466DRAFT_569584 [Polyporus arcularius HHB13444]|uniref:Uncharacterized protein n=1 Tax=Polyporus arcularius HHB13444 TaxID=1314778 RepID=A0A5C3NU45_9APHY|nr:hypothetical protein K466DRAFT_569584 [Polyporus arcularius HHB13444]
MSLPAPAIPDAPAPMPVPEAAPAVPPIPASTPANFPPTIKLPMLHADNSRLMPPPDMRYGSAPTIKLRPPKMPHTDDACLLPPSAMCHDSTPMIKPPSRPAPSMSKAAFPVHGDFRPRASSSSSCPAPGLAPAETRQVSPPPSKCPRLSVAPTTTRSSLPVFRTPGFGRADSTSSRTDPWAVRIAPGSENIPGACSTSRYRKRGQPPT